jgi:hypothetical protein
MPARRRGIQLIAWLGLAALLALHLGSWRPQRPPL